MLEKNLSRKTLAIPNMYKNVISNATKHNNNLRCDGIDTGHISIR